MEELRNPKAESRKKAEGRNPKAAGIAGEPGIIEPGISDFGFRPSGFYRVGRLLHQD
jgi:hypothetical protein